jgi:uncharacterized damage-inducible protein DinB
VDLSRKVVTDRGENGQLQERIGAILPHLFQHQIHHRGQAHAMLSGTGVKPPQLDEFLLASDARFRVEDLEALGWDEATLLARTREE